MLHELCGSTRQHWALTFKSDSHQLHASMQERDIPQGEMVSRLAEDHDHVAAARCIAPLTTERERVCVCVSTRHSESS